MLTQDEELWQKELPPNVEALLASNLDPLASRSDRTKTGQDQPRDKTRAVSYRVPHNAAVQVYDYREKKARVLFGPDMVMLGPDEQFTMLSLSGDKPKRANVIKAICLLLGPDFFTDVITIETADHARLQLQLSYNWWNSNRIICSAVFGFDEKLAVRQSLRFSQNHLTISSVDIQSVEPVDQRTRDSLQKSVQLAIEITTNSQEAAARSMSSFIFLYLSSDSGLWPTESSASGSGLSQPFRPFFLNFVHHLPPPERFTSILGGIAVLGEEEEEGLG
ncbi:Major vault protein [Liparis tanakae]|uniref:Major vault protein n=1 Tax=Liparis tanakae TaxID=230148 RepID=A0A4Z2FGU7_9TELE|nr:Major vault protein [Liparis tanakae]